ncbi:MAG: transposase [Theionarchaea archaeon]|nr:MAG: hypothetical protein AYK19_03630 [Theionarchaea archaeon DG-70-1]MBU7026400.1 transposase [Theionarchaea archaeon]
MTLESRIVEKINAGRFSPEILECIVFDYLKMFREKIMQKFYYEKAGNTEKQFAEYILIETTRALLQMRPVTFFLYLKNREELRDILSLKYLEHYEGWRDFDRKRKYFKRDFSKVLKKSLNKKIDEIFILDTTIEETDLSKIRKDKMKDGIHDAEQHSSTKGSEVGFIVCTLINWSTLSTVKTEIFPNNTSKKEIWEKMVIDTLKTKTGKIKLVIADKSFFAYQNYLSSLHYEIIPLIKPGKNLKDEVIKKIEDIPASQLWWDQRYAGMLDTLLEDFGEIIEMTTSRIPNYDKSKEIRAQIEIVFKTSKIYGMKELHVYYKNAAHWKVYIQLYLASLFLQYLKLQKININRAIKYFQQKS